MLLRRIKNKLYRVKSDVLADYYLRKLKNRKYSGNSIKVGFLVQMPELWDKQNRIYEEMLKRPDFKPVLIVIPGFDLEKNQLRQYGVEYEFFRKKYPESLLYKYDDPKLNIQEMDYLFMQRPYDMYMPNGLKSYDIVKFAKLCYLPYGMICSDVFVGLNSNREFFRNVYAYFADSEDMLNAVKNKYKNSVKAGIRHHVFLGYPELENYFNLPHTSKAITVTWTPRWTTDKTYGGSNFLKYKDKMLTIPEKYDVKMIFRPHPLMFENFIKTGIFSAEQVDEYKKELKDKGIILDIGTDIYDTFCQTDILITDISTIIGPFFVSGRPIIYCNGNIELNRLYSKMIDNSYRTDTFEDIEKALFSILNNQDIKKENRQNYIGELKKIHDNASVRITDYIKKDSNKQ
ncbi:MAG: CDP-glycerol glycerophosphotransferase family protein [Lachnospiraceae bacterium]|nr:CDP-glycerol glycerophosphotransferase family protein [Erysipelotrichaceae bacterium]MBR4342434.1 CDP-glycerol glycerophosphotransferase family protein [Lachnospiraceae bacterium]